jgi:aminotransferase
MSTERSPQGVRYQFAVIREKMRRHPGPVLDFALGRRRHDPPKWLADFVRSHAELGLRRRSDDEFDALVDAASRMLANVYRVEVSGLSILPAPSGRAALSAVAAIMISPGDGVVVTEPGYPAFARIAAQNHARLAVVPLDPDNGFAPDVDAVPEGDPAIRLAALNYPNNPTGTVLSRKAFEALRQRLDPDVALFNDAIYGPLTFERPPWSLLAGEVSGFGASIVELHSLGKLFALGPLGVAFLVGPERLVEPIRRFSDFIWTQVSSLQARVAVRCLDDWSSVDTVREGLRQRLARLRAVVTDLGFEPYPTDAGMYLLCRSPRRVDDHPVDSAVEAAELLLAQHGLAVAPWDVGRNSYIRFSAQYRDEDLDALAAIRFANCY